MTVQEPISVWLQRMKEGDSEATYELWQRYFKRLVGLAKKMLESTPRRARDEEDVALSAFKSFCLRAEAGKFPQLEDRDDLWKLLMTITVRKALRAREKGARELVKRTGEVIDDQVFTPEPDPEEAALLADEFQHLLSLLGDERLRAVALLKLEGYTNQEIAERFDRHVSFAERKLQLIRRIWSQEQGE